MNLKYSIQLKWTFWFRPEPEASVDLRSHFLRDFRVHVDFSLDKNLSAWKSKICLRGLA